MKTEDTKLAERVAQGMLAQDAMSRALGISILEIRSGYARLKMTVRPDMANSHSICPGVAIFTLADSAFAFACNSYNRSTVASGFSIDFVPPARIGDELIAEATESKGAVCQGENCAPVTNRMAVRHIGADGHLETGVAGANLEDANTERSRHRILGQHSLGDPLG